MPVTGETLRVEGLADLQRAFKAADRRLHLELRKELRDIARPVERGIEARAISEFSRIGDKWWNMRIGVTRNMVYVAPTQRSRFTRANPARYQRRKFAARLYGEMVAELRANEAGTVRRMERLLAKVGRSWERA
jgi:hypothetical protein